jgi:beta-lactamase regulating signal transducer with metallopeptidase domain
MAADLLTSGVALTLALTLGLLGVMLLRRPVRALFGARAAYGLWLLVPAMVVAVALPGPTLTTHPIEPTAPVAATAAAAPAPLAAVRSAVIEMTPNRPAFIANPKDFALPLALIWTFGALACAGVLAWRQTRFLSQLGPLRPETRSEGRVYHAAHPGVGPALVGALMPRVILPGDFSDRFSLEEQAVVVAHERIHLTGGDAQINLAAAAIQALFWFHPLVHLGARLMRIDQELACDETVVARFPGARRLYAEAMLKVQLAAAPLPLGCHWPAGGVSALRHRIGRLSLRPSGLRRLTGLGLATCLALGGGLAAWAADPSPEASQDVERASASTRDLMEAIENGRNDRAAEMIRAGTNVNGGVLGEGFPLLLAVREGQLGLARLLLDHGANPDFAVSGDGSALIAAADNGDLAMVELLLAARANVDIAVQGDGSPLIAAAAGGHLPVVERLLVAGATVDKIVPSDETALITAARMGHTPVVERLVEAGADVNLAVQAPRYSLPPERRSPLGMARRAGRADMVDYLIARGARP